MKVGFKFELLPRTERVLVSGALTYFNDRTVNPRRRMNKKSPCNAWSLALVGSNAKCIELMAWFSDALTQYVSNRKDEASMSVRLLIGTYLLLVKG